jgi:hypothetical protein
MRKTTIASIIYILGLIFSALVIELFDNKTSIIKASIGLIWTIVFLISLFYADKYEKK